MLCAECLERFCAADPAVHVLVRSFSPPFCAIQALRLVLDFDVDCYTLMLTGMRSNSLYRAYVASYEQVSVCSFTFVGVGLVARFFQRLCDLF